MEAGGPPRENRPPVPGLPVFPPLPITLHASHRAQPPGPPAPRGKKFSGDIVLSKIIDHYKQGRGHLAREEWESAVLSFSKAINFKPLPRAEAYIQLCDFGSATQNLRKAWALGSRQPENRLRLAFVFYLQGQCLYEQESYLEALELFTQAAEIKPHNLPYLMRSITCLTHLNHHKDCLTLVSKELQANTRNPDLYILRACFYNRFAQVKPCYQDIYKALALEHQHPEAHSLLKILVGQAQRAREDAVRLALKGRLRDSLLRIHWAIENSPMDPGHFLFRGTLYRRLKDFQAAIRDFHTALDLIQKREGKDCEVLGQTRRQLLLSYNDFAVHCYSKGFYQEAILLLNKALKGETTEKGLYLNRGDCFFQLGELNFALADYQRALELSPADQGAHVRMGMLQNRMGLQEHQMRQYGKAEVHFSSAIEHSPERAGYYLHRAKTRLMLRDIAGARQDMAIVMLLDPNLPQVLPLMTNLFPGQSVEQVLSSKAADLAQVILERVTQRRVYPGLTTSMLRKPWPQETEFWLAKQLRAAEQLRAARQLRGAGQRPGKGAQAAKRPGRSRRNNLDPPVLPRGSQPLSATELARGQRHQTWTPGPQRHGPQWGTVRLRETGLQPPSAHTHYPQKAQKASDRKGLHVRLVSPAGADTEEAPTDSTPSEKEGSPRVQRHGGRPPECPIPTEPSRNPTSPHPQVGAHRGSGSGPLFIFWQR
ncbi:tetratricopeptide repeat protein 16 [Tachyglossus aculeatus]|uniref:tetratricopeptide repeat protein 16 n=1 Tax=Tachyglossus aculeatus TaxID=9261 RepID=UPI0018F39D30|nr:tetratricopeptide repeat protein 16 [Tachyglossus aculeatus]